MLQAQIYIDKDERLGLKPLYEFILEFLIKESIAGATAFRGTIGFGANKQMNRPNDLFSFDEVPMVITFVDEEEKVRKTLTELRKHIHGGLIITNQVEKW